MNFVEKAFLAVDIIMDKPQNRERFAHIIREQDKVYREDYPDECKAHYYYKDKDATKPVMLYVHGGGFVMGDKSHRISFSERIADENYFVFNANHRLCPKYPFPAMIEDAFYMLNKIAELKDEYNLDLNKIVLSGDSSGAYLTAMTIACLTNKELHDKLSLPECKVKATGFMGFCGPYDVVKMITDTFPPTFTRQVGESLLGMRIKPFCKNIKDYPLYDYLSPINFITDNWCKTSLIIYSKKDLFCPRQGEEICDLLRKHNVDVTEFYATKFASNHCFHLMTLSDDAQKADIFIKNYLRKINGTLTEENEKQQNSLDKKTLRANKYLRQYYRKLYRLGMKEEAMPLTPEETEIKDRHKKHKSDKYLRQYNHRMSKLNRR